MPCRGIYLALSDDEAKRVLGATGDDKALIESIRNFEERWDEEWLAETDKAWDAIHRCLTDGRLDFKALPPRGLCVLGGRQLHKGDGYIVSFATPEQVKEVAAAIRDIDEDWMRERYFAISEEDYGCELCEDDCGYTWSYFEDIRVLYEKAAHAGRAVLFMVDQ